MKKEQIAVFYSKDNMLIEKGKKYLLTGFNRQNLLICVSKAGSLLKADPASTSFQASTYFI
jgi:hypothetical protein